MGQIDRSFVAIGLIWLILGMALGIYMGITGDNKYLTVHVAMLLGGFVVLSFYGLIYRAWPAMNAGPLPKLQFWLAVAGELAIAIGTIMIVNDGSVALVAIGSVAALAAAMMMSCLFVTRAH